MTVEQRPDIDEEVSHKNKKDIRQKEETSKDLEMKHMSGMFK